MILVISPIKGTDSTIPLSLLELIEKYGFKSFSLIDETYFNNSDAPIRSSPYEMQRYLSKISGPLLDRIDLHIEVTPE